MGSGKSHWGKLWGTHHHLTFYDLDILVEEQEGMSINDIFQQFGEAHFRKIETKILRQFAFQKDFILACGGGTPCFFDNMEWMNEHGITIYLNPSVATIAGRLMEGGDRRPLVKGLHCSDISSYTEQKIRERESYYLKANLVLPEQNINQGALKDILIKNND